MRDVVKSFNSLHGKKVTRKYLDKIGMQAIIDGEHEVVARIAAVLQDNPKAEHFQLEIDRPINRAGLGVSPDNQSIDDLVCGLDRESHRETGLGAPVPASEIYDMITKKITAAIRKPLNWNLPWQQHQSGGYLIAYNFESKKPYRGVNSFMLGSLHLFNPEIPLLENPYYMTFEQVKKHKGKIRKGSKAHQVVYYSDLHIAKNKTTLQQFGSFDQKKVKSFADKHQIPHNEIEVVPMLKYYNVYSGADIDGINFDLKNFKGKGYIEPIKAVWNKHEKIDLAERVTSCYPKLAPKIIQGGNDALYNRQSDTIKLPEIGQFKFVQAYYTTKYHELIHSTGSPNRLAREKGRKFGDRAYCFEELIAETGAAFLSAEAGILHYTFHNTAAYIKGWRKALLQWAEKDNKFIFRAASQAQKAVDFILDRDADGIPKYEKKTAMKVRFSEVGKKAGVRFANEKGETQRKTEKTLKAIAALAKTQIEEKRRKRQLKSGEQYTIEGLASPVTPVVVIEATAQPIPISEIQVTPVAPGTQPTPIADAPAMQPSSLTNPKANRLMSMKFDALQFPGVWQDFMQSPAKNLKLTISGKPKNGKTSGALDFANMLTEFGRVLYNFADQGFNKSTQDLWIQSGLVDKPNAIPCDAMTLDDLAKEIGTNRPDFVFIDMINAYIDREKIKPYEFQDRFIKKYPDTGFVLIMESTKGGDFKGDQGWTHIVDSIAYVDNFLMENRGRYGNGHYVIWEDGLRRYNPRRYDEIFSDTPDDYSGIETVTLN
jgi:antirestriction protein ArdC